MYIVYRVDVTSSHSKSYFRPNFLWQLTSCMVQWYRI